MTCAKVKVHAILQGASGRYYMGSNRCENPQAKCPREPGDDYTKCKTICQQPAHAEIDALQKAGDDAKGGTLWIDYYYICPDCKVAVEAADVQVHVGLGK